MVEPSLVARREKVGQFVGAGCFIQGVGLGAPFVLYFLAGPVGAVIGVLILVVLFFVGSAKAKNWRCSNCKNPIADANVRICPVCKAHFE
jgi:hypothetical protein